MYFSITLPSQNILQTSCRMWTLVGLVFVVHKKILIKNYKYIGERINERF